MISEAMETIEYLEQISLELDWKEVEAHYTIPFSTLQSSSQQATVPHTVTDKLTFNTGDKQHIFTQW